MKKTLSLLLSLIMLLAGCGTLAENAGVTLTDPYCGITLTVDAEHANLGLDTQTMLDYETNLLSCAVLSMYEEALLWKANCLTRSTQTTKTGSTKCLTK